MNIRLAQSLDVKFILPLFKELDAKHYRNSVDVKNNINDERYLVLFDNFFKENSNLIITVAEDNKEIIAFALSKITVVKNNFVFRDSLIGEILYLAVDKNYKRMGVATQIMSDMEDRLKSKGVDRLETRVFSFNDETFPEKINYKPKYTVYEKYI